MAKRSTETIVVVTNQLKNIKSGVGTLANVIINELKSDYKILIICPHEEKILSKDKNITIESVNVSKYDPTGHKWLSFSKQAANITNKLKTSEFKLIIFLDARESYFAKKNIPKLGLIHDFYSDRFSRLTKENIRTYPDWFKRLIYFKIIKRLEVRAYKRLDWIVTDSEFAKTELLKNYNSKLGIHVIRNGIDFSKLKKTNEPKEKNSILFVGGNFYRKGLVELLEAVDIVSKSHEIKCYVIGEDANSKRLQNITKNAQFLGSLSYEQTSDYYNKCQIFCMPSHFENYAMVYLEALYYNMEVIASTNSGTVEIKKYFDNLHLVEPKNVNQLAEVLRKLLEKKTRTKTNNLNIISSQIMGRQYKILIKKIINANREISD